MKSEKWSGKVRELSIYPTNSAPFFGKIYPNGKVEEIILPPNNDKTIFPVGSRTGGKGRMGAIINTNANTNLNTGGGNGRMGATINTNANTNTGATVTVNNS